MMLEAYDNKVKAIKDAVGVELESPFRVKGLAPKEMIERGESGSAFDFFDKRLEELKQKHPDKADIFNPVRPEAAKLAREAEKRHSDDVRNYSGPIGTGVLADFVGGFGAMAKDPVNAPLMLIGPTGHVARGAKAIIGMGVKQALVNAGGELVSQPLIQQWRKDAGLHYGMWDAATDVAMAGAFGFGMDAGIRTLYRGVQKGIGRAPIVDNAGAVTGYESAAAAKIRADNLARDAEIAENIKSLTPEDFKAFDAGDTDAAIKIAKALKLDEQDPSVGGAINALRNTDRVTLDGIDDGWRERSLLQQLRAIEDPAEPAPVHFDAAARAERANLSDLTDLPKGTEGNQHYRMLDLDGKPVRFEAIDANRITTDPATFQFKGGRDAAGASNALRAVDFDGSVKGKVIVYEREDGSLVVADGHDRVSLANRAPEPVKLDALVFREKDGWTAEQVRAEAAKKNIQEGTGSLMDVAGAIRRHPEIVDDSMAVSTDFMADARSIARLSDEAFDAVAGGQFNPKHGVLVSDLVPDQSRHMEVLRELDRRNPPTEAAARREIGNMLREPANIETLTRVMDIPLAEPHVLEARNDVLAGVITTLRQEPGYIGEIETQAIAAVIRRLAEKPGLVSDTLAQAGRAVAEGQPLERAIDATLRRFEDVIGKAGVKGLADQPVRLSPDERPRFLAALSGSDAAVGRSMRADLDRLGYYSKALEAAKSLKQSKGTPEQMLSQLKSAGVKDAEIEATNLRSFLDGKTSVTRDDLVRHLTENRVGVNEVVRGDEIDADRTALRDYLAGHMGIPSQQTERIISKVMAGDFLGSKEHAELLKADRDGALGELVDNVDAKSDFYSGRQESKWSSHSLDPSNPTYRETVLHLPSIQKAAASKYRAFEQEMTAKYSKPGWSIDMSKLSPDERATLISLQDAAVTALKSDFQSGHFSEPNIIGHMMTSLNKHEGKPVFTLDQIQSDWGQKLRDGGVRDEGKIATLKSELDAARGRYADLTRRAEAEEKASKENGTYYVDSRVQKRIADIKNKAAEAMAESRRLNAEHSVATASAPGHPLVNTTDQWTNTTLRRALRQAVEADAEFIAIPHGDTVLSYNPGDEGGMRGFYGSRTSEGIVPKNLRKLLEKIDKDSAKPTKVETLDTPSGKRGWQGPGLIPKNDADASQTGFTLFPLTDKVKRSVMEEGQPLFAKPAENITPTKLNELAENLRQALDEATTPPPGRLDDPIKDAPKQVERLREDLAEDIAVAMGQPSPAQLAAIRAYHGSPHDFDKFDLSKIGTGEGAQAYGFGLYFAENEGVARSYRDALAGDSTAQLRVGDQPFDINNPVHVASYYKNSGNFKSTADAIADLTAYPTGQRIADGVVPDETLAEAVTLLKRSAGLFGKRIPEMSSGRLYEVNIKADPNDFLDWDKNAREQPAHLIERINALRSAGKFTEAPNRFLPRTPDETAAFRDAGIPGIRYLDQGSRGAGEGSRNYVVFDDNLVEIVAKDGKPITPEEKKNILADMRRQQAEERAAKQQAEQPQQQAQPSPLLDLYQRYVTQGREALDAVMPGTGRMIDEFVQANPEVVSRIAEALGAPTGRPQAAQILEQAMPQFMSPRIIDMSKPVLLTPEANARMREIRTAIDETVKMLPPEYRIRVEDSLVFNFGDGDKRLDGLHDGYEKLIYVSMAAGDPVRTSRHEVIHALRQSGLMKDEEFAALYKFADRLGLRKAYEIDAQYKEPYATAYGNRGADYVEQLLREETVANMFSDYSLNGRRFGDVAGGGMVDRLIDMIVSFMKQVREIMGGYGFRNVYDVFDSIESGAMARRGMESKDSATKLAALSGENAKTSETIRNLSEALMPLMQRASDGMSIVRNAQGAIEQVTNNGRSFTVTRGEDGLVRSLTPTTPDIATSVRDSIRTVMGDNVDEAAIARFINDIMPLLRAGDRQGVDARVQQFASQAGPQPEPTTPLGIDLAEVQSMSDFSDVIMACRS